jgi:hypothetical protein
VTNGRRGRAAGQSGQSGSSRHQPRPHMPREPSPGAFVARVLIPISLMIDGRKRPFGRREAGGEKRISWHSGGSLLVPHARRRG